MIRDIRAVRTKFAYERIKAWGSAKSSASKAVKALPVLIRNMGLVGALALEDSKESGPQALASDIVAWLSSDQLPGSLNLGNDKHVDTFFGKYVRLSRERASFLENEALRFAETLKLIAGALDG